MDEAADLRIECEPLGIGTKARLVVRCVADGRVLDVDTLDLGRAADRQAYARRAASRLPWGKGDFDRELLRIAESRLGQRQSPEPPKTLSEAIDSWAAHEDEPRIETAFAPLDDLLGGGLPHGSLTVFAGRPGSGKSALALQAMIGATIIDRDLRALWGLGEMTREKLALRAVTVGSVLLGSQAAVTMDGAKARTVRARDAADELKRDIGDRISIVSPLTIESIEHAIASTGARLVVVDYLQLVRAGGAADRRQEVDAVVRSLRELTVARGLAAVAISNIAKGVGRDSRAGEIGKESSEIDFAADLLLLADPGEYDYENGPQPMRLRCLKNRHGCPRDLQTLFDGSRQLFTPGSAGEWPEFASHADRGRL